MAITKTTSLNLTFKDEAGARATLSPKYFNAEVTSAEIAGVMNEVSTLGIVLKQGISKFHQPVKAEIVTREVTPLYEAAK